MDTQTMRDEAFLERARNNFLNRVTPGDDGCWVFDGPINSGGYATTTLRGTTHNAQRAAWLLFVGAIPPGMQVDHVCRNRLCVRIAHLQLLTPSQNVARRIAPVANPLCGQGHEFTPENTGHRTGYRQGRFCRQCTRNRAAKQRQRSRGLDLQQTNGPR